MKLDALPSPGFLPNGVRLQTELIKSISYVEVQADLRAPAKPEQAKTLDTFLVACRTALASLIDVTLPTFVSGLLDRSDNPRRLVLTFSEPLDPTVVPATTAFTSSLGGAVTAVAVQGTQVTLTLTSDVAAGAMTIAYTAPGTNALRDLSGNLVATFGAQSVTNQA